jgi:hypothetical protein
LSNLCWRSRQLASLVRTTLYIEVFLQEHFYTGRAENK